MSNAGVCHCPICLNNHSIDQFLVFPCGHGFCSNCTHQLFDQSRPKCPNCRVTLHRREAHQVFLTIVDAKTALATSVVEGIDLMGPSTPLGSVKRAEGRLRRVVEVGMDEETISPILDALDSFNNRIIPLFKSVESHSKEIQKLTDDLRRTRRARDNLASKVKETESLVVEITQLRSENTHLKTSLDDAERITHQVLRSSEQAKEETAKYQDMMVEWKKQAAELDQDNRRYKASLDRQINSARTMKEKNKKLSKQILSLTEQINRKDPISDATTGEYDGDFSAHERSRISNRLSIGSTPQRSNNNIHPTPSTPHHSLCLDENELDLSMIGIPSTNFQSDWQLNNNNTASTSNVLKKRSLNDPNPMERRRVTNPIHVLKKAPATTAPAPFPISLDSKGHPTRPIHFGPRYMS